MKKILWVFLFLPFIGLSLSGCNTYKAEEANKNSFPNLMKENAVSESVIVSDISIEKFKDQKQTIYSNENSNYLIKFKVASFSADSVYIVTLKDSSCLDIGGIGWKRGREDASWMYESRYYPELHKKVYPGSNPIQLYYPFKFIPDADSIFYLVGYSQEKKPFSRNKYIEFKVTPSEKGPKIKLWKKNNL